MFSLYMQQIPMCVSTKVFSTTNTHLLQQNCRIYVQHAQHEKFVTSSQQPTLWSLPIEDIQDTNYGRKYKYIVFLNLSGALLA
jgi:hypothetical protein